MTNKKHSDQYKNQKPPQGASTSEDMFNRRRAKALGKVSCIMDLWKAQNLFIVQTLRNAYYNHPKWHWLKDPTNNADYIHARKQTRKAFDLKMKLAKLFFMKNACIVCGSQIGTIAYTGKYHAAENWCSKCGCKIEGEKP
jgi:hypothetical protein